MVGKPASAVFAFFRGIVNARQVRAMLNARLQMASPWELTNFQVVVSRGDPGGKPNVALDVRLRFCEVPLQRPPMSGFTPRLEAGSKHNQRKLQQLTK